MDDGGTDDGGVDETVDTFTSTSWPLNDAPTGVHRFVSRSTRCRRTLAVFLTVGHPWWLVPMRSARVVTA